MTNALTRTLRALGIKRRAIAAPDETASDYATKAALRAMDRIRYARHELAVIQVMDEAEQTAGAAEATFGRLVEAPAAVFHKMNEEHGYVDVTQTGRSFALGERLHIIPNHICVAVNLHERVYGIRHGELEEVWDVAGRGKLQ